MLLATIKVSIKNMFSRFFLKITILCLLLTIVCYGLFIWGVVESISLFLNFSYSWINSLLQTLSGVGAVIVGWFALPALLPLIASCFQDPVAKNIEKREYPGCTASKSLSIWHELLSNLKFILRIVVLNILCIPFYFIPIINLGIYYILNGYLLGAEFFDVQAARRVGFHEAPKLRKRHKLTVFSAGLCILFITNIPVINLMAPLIATIIMVHLAHKTLLS